MTYVASRSTLPINVFRSGVVTCVPSWLAPRYCTSRRSAVNAEKASCRLSVISLQKEEDHAPTHAPAENQSSRLLYGQCAQNSGILDSGNALQVHFFDLESRTALHATTLPLSPYLLR